jgi:hypothetical protein
MVPKKKDEFQKKGQSRVAERTVYSCILNRTKPGLASRIHFIRPRT